MVNWNGASFLDSLLRSVQECAPAEMVVIDNQSTDESVAVLQRHPSVITVLNSANLGFGSAANQGIRMTHAPFVLVANTDIEAAPGSIDLLEQYMTDHPEAAAAAPRLVFPDGRLQTSLRSFPTPLRLFLYLSYLDRIFPSGYRLGPDQHRELKEVDQPMGAALLFRRTALEKLGGFDPQFFMYMEDVDLCDRLKSAGWKIAYIPQAQMVHHAGGSSNQDWERTQRNFLESVVRYFRKRSSETELVLLRGCLALALLFRSLVFAVSGRFRKAWFYLRTVPLIVSRSFPSR